MSASSVISNNTWLYLLVSILILLRIRINVRHVEVQRFEKHILQMLGDVSMIEPNLRIFEKWRQEMLTKNFSDSYMNDILKPMKAILRYANDYFDMNIEYIDKIQVINCF